MRGEITVVVGGAEPKRAEDTAPDELAALVAAREAEGEHRKAAIAAVAAQTGVPKRAVFDAVVAAKEEKEGSAGESSTG